jgi:hypothetical protein
MDDVNTDVLPNPSAETPAGGASAETPELELELDPEAVGDDQAAGEDELEDWEEEGKTYKVPKPLKPHLLRNKDYTQSKQQLAEQRKADEAARKDFEQEQTFHRENIVTVAKITNMDEQLKAFRAITPEQWAQMDPAQASKLQIKFNLLKDQKESLVGELRQKQHQALEKQRTTFAKQFEDGQARIAAKIPGWSDEFAGKLTAYGVEQGLSVDELEALIPKENGHAHVGVLRKAYLYDQLVAKQRARPKADAEVTPTPVPKVGARRNPPSSEPLDSDSPDVWIRKRNKQLGIGA